MGQDGIFITALARELSELCVPARIDKIYQPQRDELLFHLGTPEGRRLLYYSSNPSHPGLFLVEEAPANPPEPGSFCMLLRKHLLGGRITAIRQRDTERIIEIQVETRDEMHYAAGRTLVAEIMGKHSNLMLLESATGRIVDAMKRVPLDLSKARQVLPGLVYELPPGQDKRPYTQVDRPFLLQLLSGPEPERRILDAIQGFSPQAAAHVAGLAPEAAWDFYRDLLDKAANGGFEPRIYLDAAGDPVDFHVLPLSKYEGLTALPLPSPSQVLRDYYRGRKDSDRQRQQASELERVVAAAVKKNLLKQKRIREDLIRAREAEQDKLMGELLTASLHLVRGGETSVTVANYYDGGSLEIPLDARLTPAKNAQAYYRRYAKSKRTLQEKGRQLAQTEDELAYLESVQAFLDETRDREVSEAIRQELVDAGFLRPGKTPQKKKNAKGKPLRYPAPGGMEILVGRNNTENDELTFRLAARTDLWFHAKDYHGSHVILRTDNREPLPEAVEAAAAAAAWFSKGRFSAKVPVDMTRVRYVKKTPGARPGQVIFTNQQTLNVDPSDPGSRTPSAQ
jgi:predicted ribosome quality control (RQC) complex YloA/Tae2 family protein